MIISNKKYIAEVNTSITKGLARGAVIGSALFGGMNLGAKMLGIGRYAQGTQSSQISTPDIQTKSSSEVTNKQPIVTDIPTQPQYHHDVIKKIIKGDEGLKNKMYLDTKGIKTVGYGHNLQNVDRSKESFKNAFGNHGESLRKHILSGGSLSSEQSSKLFDTDYQEHLNRAVNFIPNLHEHPPEVQAVLVSGTYRGHIGDSPKFRQLFNTGKYHEAASEFLNRKEYRNPDPNAPGVITRLERDHKILLNYAHSVNKK